MTKTNVFYLFVIGYFIGFFVGIAVARSEPKSCPLPANCYATCRQFESALLVGCYLADRDKTKTHKQHEDFCKALAKELMGKDSGCGQKESKQ